MRAFEWDINVDELKSQF